MCTYKFLALRCFALVYLVEGKAGGVLKGVDERKGGGGEVEI